jgi:hypothetical protein
MQALAERVEATLAPTNIYALPATPYLGQRVVFVADANGGVSWDLMWGGLNWWFVGGPPALAVDAAAVAVNNAWAASTPSLPVPLTGIYDIRVSAKVDGGAGANGQAMFMTATQGGVGMVDGDSLVLQSGHAYGGWTPFTAAGERTKRMQLYRTSGNVQAAYHNNGSGSAYATDRKLSIVPVYVAPAGAQLLEPAAYELWLAKQPELEAPIADPPDVEALPA